MDGNTLAFGTGSGASGAVHIYVYDGSNWNEQQVISNSTFEFGLSVDVHGDTLMVGSTHSSSQGRIHIYTRSGSTWTEQYT